MTLTIETNDGVLVLSPRGRIDHHTSDKLREALMSHIQGPEGAIQLVVRFAGVDYINSEGLQVLLFVSQRLARMKGRLVLCEMNEHIRAVFRISGLDRVLPVTETEADALKRLHH
ncbi:MAG: STAS domain-containing protein [Acidobacteria bacterium]|nr:STAS domain-containing protein [Acidobacteriota bacterium]MYH22423.1 STAS domain-containing protein [Acidobacteriota bacterium]MYK79523.1 STAS domain-containing protein [Acidobacteriota bacterium]